MTATILMGNAPSQQTKPLMGGSPYSSFVTGPAGPAARPVTYATASPTASPGMGGMAMPGMAVHQAPVTYLQPQEPTPGTSSEVYVPAASHRSHESHGQAECKGGECKGAEAECTNQEECGGDDKGPLDSDTVCGIDKKPLLPLGLGLSTILSGVCMLFVQIPLLQKICLMRDTHASILFYTVVGMYGLTTALGWYCAVVDAGQMPKRNLREDGKLPIRSHKTWLYKRPVRRFDHYCRWLTNSIALWNHREFVLMVTFLSLISVFCTVVDTILIVQSSIHHQWGGGDMSLTWNLLGVVVHLLCSLVLFYLVLPILYLHIGFISRNELAKEFNKDIYRVMKQTSDGRTDVPVTDISSDEFNQANADDFMYAPEKNPFDKGWFTNCMTFWCHARWRPDESGDF